MVKGILTGNEQSIDDPNIDVSLYSSIVGDSPIDPTADIPTTGATFSYSEATVTNLASSIDPSITNIGYKRCHDIGHASTGRLIVTIPFPGFGVDGIANTPDSLARRWASYVDPDTGRSPLVVCPRTRGRGGASGTLDYARDSQDIADIIDSAVSAVGNSVYGYSTTGGASAICIGYSTGGLDALNFAARFPDRCLGVILYYPNYDIGFDTQDSYYVLQRPDKRTQIAASVHPGGDTRMSAGVANLDQYLARNPIDAIARIMAIPNGPHVWLISDLNETEILPSATRLQKALQAIPAAKSKAHIHLTQTGDANRVLHADGLNGASEIYAERYFFPYLLNKSTEWTMPRRSPESGLRVLGWMKTKLFELWMGPNTAPKTAAGAGGKDHAAELRYDDYTRRFKINPLCSTNGYVQVLRDADNHSETFTAGTEKTVDLNIVRSISAVTDIGIEHSFRADVGVTNVSGVTNWADQIGALAFTESTNKPALTTDSDSKSLIRFTGSSSHKLVLPSLLVDPTQDFTVFVVTNKTNTTLGSLIECSHHGTNARAGLQYTSAVTSGYAYDNAGSWAIANTNGIGGQVWGQNKKRVLVLMRKSNVLYAFIDGDLWSYSPYNSGTTFTTTGTNTTSIGCGWANGGGAYWQFFTGDVYEVDSKQSATSEVDVYAYVALMRSRWTF